MKFGMFLTTVRREHRACGHDHRPFQAGNASRPGPPSRFSPSSGRRFHAKLRVLWLLCNALDSARSASTNSWTWAEEHPALAMLTAATAWAVICWVSSKKQ